MRKIILIIVSFLTVIAIVIGCAYVVDMNRMENNKPVIFSDWGYDYAPPEIQQTAYKHSFVGKVIEETTKYMIVEPVEDKADSNMGEKVKVEYGTDHLDFFTEKGGWLLFTLTER